ncbi:uncharacterized protein VP01_928g4 [Puccinia sorghi]|uniref:Uncharacterized protein n=1 Tax=Puccinia sorghi TaxID=27349 RepID=A0A0L6U962_9BASI|nr:uncharacterized protein VP01_928g4 [Puccinia sorghi]
MFVEMVNNNQHPRHSYPISKQSSGPALAAAPQSANQSSSRKPSRAEAQWVAFPQFPEVALQSFSSAVQFVSTTLKPLTEPSIAYPSGHLPNHLSRANSLLSSSSRFNSFSASKHTASSLNSNGGLKRCRTTTASTVQTPMSRKRSKSDFGYTSHQHTDRVMSSAHSQAFGSSASLIRLNAPRSKRQHSRTPDSHTPASLIRQKQRLSEASAEISGGKRGSNASPYPQHVSAAVRSSSSLKSSASVTSLGTLYPSRPRAYSQLNTTPSQLQEEEHPLGPVRKTYLGGVGVYLNHDQDEGENSQDELDCPRPGSASSCKPKPNLTINVGLCQDGAESAKNAGSWFNRLLISPLSSAGSSVYSFLVNGASTSLAGTDDAENLHAHDSEKELAATPSATKSGPSWRQPFRRHK